MSTPEKLSSRLCGDSGLARSPPRHACTIDLTGHDSDSDGDDGDASHENGDDEEDDSVVETRPPPPSSRAVPRDALPHETSPGLFALSRRIRSMWRLGRRKVVTVGALLPESVRGRRNASDSGERLAFNDYLPVTAHAISHPTRGRAVVYFAHNVDFDGTVDPVKLLRQDDRPPSDPTRHKSWRVPQPEIFHADGSVRRESFRGLGPFAALGSKAAIERAIIRWDSAGRASQRPGSSADNCIDLTGLPAHS